MPGTDFNLDLLTSEPAKRQLHYGVVAVNTSTDVEVPAPPANLNLRLADRDACWPDRLQSVTLLTYINVQTTGCQVALPLGAGNPLLAGNNVYQGFISAQANAGGTVMRAPWRWRGRRDSSPAPRTRRAGKPVQRTSGSCRFKDLISQKQ